MWQQYLNYTIYNTRQDWHLIDYLLCYILQTSWMSYFYDAVFLEIMSEAVKVSQNALGASNASNQSRLYGAWVGNFHYIIASQFPLCLLYHNYTVVQPFLSRYILLSIAASVAKRFLLARDIAKLLACSPGYWYCRRTNPRVITTLQKAWQHSIAITQHYSIMALQHCGIPELLFNTRNYYYYTSKAHEEDLHA